MILDEFAADVRRTHKADQLTEERILCAAMGLAGESGEVVDLIKKWWFQEHLLDRVKLIDELGDVAYYLVLMCETINHPLEDVLKDNITKRALRYPNGFDAARSRDR